MESIAIENGEILITPNAIDDLKRMKDGIILSAGEKIKTLKINRAEDGTIGSVGVILEKKLNNLPIWSNEMKEIGGKKILNKQVGFRNRLVITDIDGGIYCVKQSDKLFKGKKVLFSSTYEGDIYIWRNGTFIHLDSTRVGKGNIYMATIKNKNIQNIVNLMIQRGYIRLMGGQSYGFLKLDSLKILQYKGEQVFDISTTQDKKIRIKLASGMLYEFEEEQDVIKALGNQLTPN